MKTNKTKSTIGLKRGTVKLVKHNPKWKQSFKNEAKKIKNIFGSDALDIQHVGSTAIAKIPAKPIIDLALSVKSLKKAKKYTKKLNKIGYQLKEKDSQKNRLFFSKGPEENRTHYLHIGKKDGDYIQDMILFRDFLLKDDVIAEKYSKLKSKLAQKYPNKREQYTAGKEKFIKESLKKEKKDNKINFAKEKKFRKAIKLLQKSLKKSGNNSKPVLEHSLKITEYLYLENYNQEIIVGAILHDILEDTDTKYEQIKKEFGKKVADLVKANSFDRKITNPTDQYKDMFRRCLIMGNPALIIKTVDILDNSYYYHLVKNKNKRNALIQKMKYFIDLTEKNIGKEKIWRDLNKQYKLLKKLK